MGTALQEHIQGLAGSVPRRGSRVRSGPGKRGAQALGVRWKQLVGGFTGGDRQIGQGLNRMYADRPNWPAHMTETMAPFSNPKVWECMGRVLKCASIA